ncbi:MAG: diguanylate cyclase [Chloroflexota bacterium]|nr:diguanylate cyclase [Chloroflexota bacterium]
MRTLLWLTSDPAAGAEAVRQLGYFGYIVNVVTTLPALLAAVGATPPQAVLLEATALDDAAQIVAIAMLIEVHAPLVTAIFVIGPDDLVARLRVARAGGAGYFTSPLDLSRLLTKLDTPALPLNPDRYRILLVDDDPMMIRFYTRVLERAGMVTRAVLNPFTVFAVLQDFYPDLILMDLYMPECSGPELAAVIRDEERFVGLPVVFLSGESDRDKQLAALQLGGDDFLTKPIAPPHLVAAITNRIERARTLRGFLARDSLTGLLNHTTSKERLTAELVRAERQASPLAFAFLDIDHFKAVNDSYGHSAGDQVIRNLARLLQGRLRRSDLVGRYGGEEFAVILPDTLRAQAAQVLDDLRARFAAIEQRAHGTTFHTTFSCGIAGVPPLSSAPALIEAADQALYRAKQQGRNRINT